MNQRVFALLCASLTFLFVSAAWGQVGETAITKWQDGKTGAVSITFDDGTVNHFRVARPLLNERDLPGTFYIVTGAIPGSNEKGRFVGRPVGEIIEETAEESTDEDNFFERASAIRYLGYKNTFQYHRKAGSAYEQGNVEAAYKVIDRGYRNVRQGKHEKKNGSWDFPLSAYMYDVLAVEPGVGLVTWDDLQSYDTDFHEIGSHTVTHPYLAVMDGKNIRYELRESREAIRKHLGAEHTFSAEAPFGTKDERVMEFAWEMYPVLRNRMPRPYLTEIPRGSEVEPGTTRTAYTLWQRGPLSDTPMDEMKEWVDTTETHSNVWLVLVFHGIEGIGWEPKSEAEMREYLDYIDAHTDDLWVTTYGDGAKYIEERMDAQISTDRQGDVLSITLTHSLGPRYNLPLTLKTYVPSSWSEAQVAQGGTARTVASKQDERGTYVQYQARPNKESVRIRRAE